MSYGVPLRRLRRLVLVKLNFEAALFGKVAVNGDHSLAGRACRGAGGILFK